MTTAQTHLSTPHHGATATTSRLRGALLLACAALAPTAACADETSTDDTAPYFDPGGAIRFNYGYLDYGPTSRLQLELMRIDLDAGVGPLFFSAQYRRYDGFNAVHHAFAGWRTDEHTDLRVGVQQVPFGLLPTVSHSFWFGSGYYLGIEDDYDLGAVWRQGNGTHQWHVGWFTGDEYGDGARYDRYSFDVADTDELPYRERGRLHARYEYSGKWAGGDALLGVSGFTGQVQDVHSRQHYTHDGLAVHGQLKRGPWTTQLQWAHYRYDVPGQRIAMSAFMFPFEIAAEADVPSFNVAYAFDRTGWLDSVTCYNNLSATLPGGSSGLRNSVQNVTGCSIGKGPMLTYIDWIAGKNMWFAGGDGIGIDSPDNSGWHSRLNLNIGFYF